MYVSTVDTYRWCPVRSLSWFMSRKCWQNMCLKSWHHGDCFSMNHSLIMFSCLASENTPELVINQQVWALLLVQSQCLLGEIQHSERLTKRCLTVETTIFSWFPRKISVLKLSPPWTLDSLDRFPFRMGHLRRSPWCRRSRVRWKWTTNSPGRAMAFGRISQTTLLQDHDQSHPDLSLENISGHIYIYIYMYIYL